MNISLVPLAVHHLRIQLEECQAIADPITERDLSVLIDKMLEDFHSRWREASYYTTTTVRAARNRKVSIPTYSYWGNGLRSPYKEVYWKGFTSCNLQGKIVERC